MIDEDKILELFGTQLQTIINGNKEAYEGYTFTITNEMQFVKNKKNKEDLKNNSKQIFIVIKFLPATLNYGQVLMPIVVNAIAEKNKLDVCYNLFIQYAETYNLQFNDDETIRQYYSSPVVLSNFNEIGDGYRSLINLSGTFQISENANQVDVGYITDTEEVIQVPAISATLSYDIQLESQSFYGVSDRTQSRGRVGTLCLNLTMYLTDEELCNKALKIMLGYNEEYPKSSDTSFYFNLTFKNGLKMDKQEFKLANFTTEQRLGELPVCTMTFTN